MEEPKYEPVYEEYEDYPEYPGMGLPASQLALIIGVNAVVSLVISVTVVLAVNWQVTPSVAVPAVTTVGDAAPSSEATVEIGSAAQSPATPEVIIYKVRAGDTLSLIADKFAVSLYDLMVANGLTNEDFIQVEQELIIPVGGLPTPTPTFTPVPPTPTETIPFDPPTPVPETIEETTEPLAMTDTTDLQETPLASTGTPLPSETPTAPPFTGVIVSIMEVVGAGDLSQEYLVIFNEGTGTSLKNWRLEGSPIGIFNFPDIFIFTGGTIRIHTKSGQSTPSDLYLNQQSPAWPAGSTIILKNNEGVEIDRYTVP